jgi:hypothetical protein
LGKVTYLDYDLDTFDGGNMLSLIMHKRSSFAHEHEVRAVILDFGNILPSDEQEIAAPGKVIEVDIQTLIKEVYVAPASRVPLMEVVQRLVEQYGLEIEVKQSGVNATEGRVVEDAKRAPERGALLNSDLSFVQASFAHFLTRLFRRVPVRPPAFQKSPTVFDFFMSSNCLYTSVPSRRGFSFTSRTIFAAGS